MVAAAPSLLRCPQEITTLRMSQDSNDEFIFKLKGLDGNEITFLDLDDIPQAILA